MVACLPCHVSLRGQFIEFERLKLPKTSRGYNWIRHPVPTTVSGHSSGTTVGGHGSGTTVGGHGSGTTVGGHGSGTTVGGHSSGTTVSGYSSGLSAIRQGSSQHSVVFSGWLRSLTCLFLWYFVQNFSS